MEIDNFESSLVLTDNIDSLPQYTAIELPVIVNSLDTATAFLGGEELLRFGIESQTSALPCKLSPNVLSGPLLGSSHGTCGVVLRLRRNKKTKEVYKVEALGRVDRMYKFSSPADYQFLPGISSATTIEVPPVPFTFEHLSEPQQLFLSEPSKAPTENVGGSEGAGESKAKPRVSISRVQQIRFGDPVPQEFAGERQPRRASNIPRSKTIVAALESLFEIWPIITRRALSTVEAFEASKYMFTLLLPEVAYCFVSNPFGNAWARYKYDPCEHPESRYMQVVYTRMRQDVHMSLLTRLKAYLGKYANITDVVNLDAGYVTLRSHASQGVPVAALAQIKVFIFSGVLSRQIHVQICDLKDDELLRHVATMKRYPQCDMVVGWFPESEIEVLRTRICEAIVYRLESFMERPLEEVVRRKPVPPDPSLATAPNYDWYRRYMDLPDQVLSQAELVAIDAAAEQRSSAPVEKQPKEKKVSNQRSSKPPAATASVTSTVLVKERRSVSGFTLLDEENSSDADDDDDVDQDDCRQVEQAAAIMSSAEGVWGGGGGGDEEEMVILY